MNIRKARPQDVETLASFNEAMAAESEGKQLDHDTVRNGVRHVLSNPAYGFYLVAERNDEIAGALLITTEWSDWRNAHFWWIQSVYVAKAYRRQGVYSALHEEVGRLARESGKVCGIRLYVDEDNRAARETYRSLGMRESRYVLYEQDA